MSKQPPCAVERVHVDPDGHEYRLGLERIPSVSEILSVSGIVDLSAVPKERLDRAAYRGSAVHQACEDFDRGRPDWWSDDPEIGPRVEAWQSWLANSRFESEYTEHVVFHSHYRYAGTLDRAGSIAGRPVIVDIKTGTRVYPSTALQLAAYDMALGLGPSMRLAVQLLPDGKYRVHEFKRVSQDDAAFLAANLLVQWRLEVGL